MYVSQLLLFLTIVKLFIVILTVSYNYNLQTLSTGFIFGNCFILCENYFIIYFIYQNCYYFWPFWLLNCSVHDFISQLFSTVYRPLQHVRNSIIQHRIKHALFFRFNPRLVSASTCISFYHISLIIYSVFTQRCSLTVNELKSLHYRKAFGRRRPLRRSQEPAYSVVYAYSSISVSSLLNKAGWKHPSVRVQDS